MRTTTVSSTVRSSSRSTTTSRLASKSEPDRFDVQGAAETAHRNAWSRLVSSPGRRYTAQFRVTF
jgi:hypothetical protein